jgi:hypothetical protein
MRLEPVCCKKRPKIVPDQLLVWRIRKGPLKVLNGTKLILDDHGNNFDSFTLLILYLTFFGHFLIIGIFIENLRL